MIGNFLHQSSKTTHCFELLLPLAQAPCIFMYASLVEVLDSRSAYTAEHPGTEGTLC